MKIELEITINPYKTRIDVEVDSNESLTETVNFLESLALQTAITMLKTEINIFDFKISKIPK